MPRVFSHYKIINFSIIVLAFFVLVLTGELAWESYTDYRAVRDMGQANAMADHLIDAAGIEAVERGLTASALGGHIPASPAALKSIPGCAKKAMPAGTGRSVWRMP